MNTQKTQQNHSVKEVSQTNHRLEDIIQEQEKTNKELTRSQRLADSMAAKVGSWGFITAQSAILAGWIGLNTLPGVPHWDQSPFILLNLVFSFASAYTAPVVLMSQNRQSDEDRKNAELDYKINRLAAQKIEVLHQKMDAMQQEQFSKLLELVKQQQESLKEIKANVGSAVETQETGKPDLEVAAKEVSEDKLVYLKPWTDTNNSTEKRVRKMQ